MLGFISGFSEKKRVLKFITVMMKPGPEICTFGKEGFLWGKESVRSPETDMGREWLP